LQLACNKDFETIAIPWAFSKIFCSPSLIFRTSYFEVWSKPKRMIKAQIRKLSE
jgi:hypothetical protein